MVDGRSGLGDGGPLRRVEWREEVRDVPIEGCAVLVAEVSERIGVLNGEEVMRDKLEDETSGKEESRGEESGAIDVDLAFRRCHDAKLEELERHEIDTGEARGDGGAALELQAAEVRERDVGDVVISSQVFSNVAWIETDGQIFDVWAPR